MTATTLASTRHDGPTATGNLYAFGFGCETWLFWTESVGDVDPQEAILYEVRVNGVSTAPRSALTGGSPTAPPPGR